MNIVFYTNSSDPKKLNKNLTPVATVSGNLREQCNVIAPVIQMTYNSAYINSVNYCYIPDFKRYYFIDGSPELDGKTVILRLKCDVLMSFKDDIMNAEVIARRSSNRYSRYLSDEYIKPYQKYDYSTSRFSTSFTPESGSYVLTVGG